MSQSREWWVRVSIKHATVQMAIINVAEGEVLVDAPTLEALMTHTKASAKDENEPAWIVTYPVIAELLEYHGFRKWEVEE